MKKIYKFCCDIKIEYTGAFAVADTLMWLLIFYSAIKFKSWFGIIVAGIFVVCITCNIFIFTKSFFKNKKKDN